MEQSPKIELAKKTKDDILKALGKIKSEISDAKKRQQTAADVAADVLASGGGPFAAVKEALTFRADKAKKKFKDKFDPLNIINRATGSKLATALAGRAMGRSEESIRKAAGLQRKEVETPMPQMVVPDKEKTEESKVVRVENGKMISSLEFIGKTLAVIARKVSDIADKLGASKKFKVSEDGTVREMTTGRFTSKEMMKTEQMQTDFLKNIWSEMLKENIQTAKFRDEQKDKDSTARYKAGFAQRKAAIVKETKPEAEESGFGKLLSNLSSFLVPAFLPMAAAIAAVVGAFGLLAVAAKMVSDKWDMFTQSFTMLREDLSQFGETIMSTVTKIKEWLVDTFTTAGDSILDAGESVVKGVKNLLGIGQTPEEERAELEQRAASGDARAQRKLAKEVVTPEKAETAATKVTEKAVMSIGATQQTAVTKESIADGSLKKQAMDSLMGVQGPTGTPEDKAAVNEVTHATSKAYQELYKMRPSQDPQREQRLPGVVDATLKSLSKTLSQTESTLVPDAPKVSQVALPASQTGQMLTNAADMKADAAIQPTQQQITPIINQIRTNKVENTTLHQSLPNPRSSESTFMRMGNRDFASS